MNRDIVEEIVEEMGLELRSYQVTTEDGYILTVFRVNSPDAWATGRTKRPVFIQHGLFMDAGYFIMHK